MNVLFTINDAYAPWCGVSIESLFINNKDLDFTVFILCNDLTEKNENKLLHIGKKYSQKIVFLKFNKETYNKLKYIEYKLKNGLNYNYFTRLLLDKLLPKNISSILYLDTDTLINGSIDEFNNLKFGDNISTYVVKDAIRWEDYKRIGTNPKEHIYFNSGVLYINLNYWRNNDVSNKTLNYILQNPNTIFPDQDALNVILKGSVKYLHPRFNCLSIFCSREEIMLHRIHKEDYKHILEAAENPTIIHYALSKPWFKGEALPYKKKWRNVFKKSIFNKNKIIYREGLTGCLKQSMKIAFGLLGIKRYKSIYNKRYCKR